MSVDNLGARSQTSRFQKNKNSSMSNSQSSLNNKTQYEQILAKKRYTKTFVKPNLSTVTGHSYYSRKQQNQSPELDKKVSPKNEQNHLKLTKNRSSLNKPTANFQRTRNTNSASINDFGTRRLNYNTSQLSQPSKKQGSPINIEVNNTTRQ